MTIIFDLSALEKKLNIWVRTLRGYIKKRELEAAKMGKGYYVTEKNLLNFIDSRPNGKKQEKAAVLNKMLKQKAVGLKE